MLDALGIGWAIKNRRAELGITQAQLAEAAGVSKRTIWSMELGRNTGVQLDKLLAVMDALGIELTLTLGKKPDVTSEEWAHPKPPAGPYANAAEPDGEYAISASDAWAILTGKK